jgi:hypothetical protein
MDSTRIKITASGFWQAFDLSQKDARLHACFVSYADHLRCRCLLGFAAVESTLALFWKSQVAPEWAENQSLMLGLLEDSNAITELKSLSGENFSRSQWSASLRYLCHLGSPTEFEAELADLCVVIPLWGRTRWNEENFQALCRNLFQLLKARRKVLRPGAELNEIEGQETIRLFEEFRSRASLLHPAFVDITSTKDSEDPVAA